MKYLNKNQLSAFKDIKINKYWNDYTINIGNQLISNNLLYYILSNFIKDIIPNISTTSYAIIYIIKFHDNRFRTISRLQILGKNTSIDKLIDLFNIYWSLRDEDYGNILISEIIIRYRLINMEIKEKTPKIPYNLSYVEITKDENNTFIYKKVSLPINTNINTWGPQIIDLNSKVVTIKRDSFEYKIFKFDDRNVIQAFKHSKLLFDFIDFLSKDSTTFKRVIGKTEYIFKNGRLLYKTVNKFVYFIKKLIRVSVRTSNFITMDIETKSINGIMSPVCICLYDGKLLKSYFITDYQNVEDMILAAFNYLNQRKYKNSRVYLHNLSKFDGVFLLKTLAINYNLKIISRFNNLISISLTFINDKISNNRTIYIYDSYLLLPSSLKDLGCSFDIYNKKGKFPLYFLNQNNINYIGSVPSIDYFPDINELDYNNYCNQFKNTNWVLKDELIKYCERDVVSLHQIIDKFSIEIFSLFKLDIIKYPTLSSLSFALFRGVFMKKENIPILVGEIYNDISQSYFGGIVDMYKPYVEKGEYYDVISEYPAVMKNKMPVGKPIFIEGEIDLRDEKSFGFFYCDIEAPKDLLIPVLPMRVNGQNICPTGTWSGWYFSEELKEAVTKYGYKVKINKGYIFEQENIFSNFVDTLFLIKKENKGARRTIAKFILNMLYGRFGMNPVMEHTEIIKSQGAESIYTQHNITDVIPLNDSLELIKYKGKTPDDKTPSFAQPNISIAIASAITAYARMKINSYKHLPGYITYYSDTDSIVLNKPLPKDMVSNDLGSMKHEYHILKGIFLMPKVYGTWGINPNKEFKEIVKVKGLKSDLTLIELHKLLYKGAKTIQTQDKWYKDWKEGNITIIKELYNLSVTSNKRILVYNGYGKLIDTLPFHVVNGIIIDPTQSITIYAIKELKLLYIKEPSKF